MLSPIKQRHHVIPASYVLYQREGRILLGLRHQTGYDDGNYNLPAGHVEALEGPLGAALREFREETGIALIASDLELVHIAYRRLTDRPERVDFYYRCVIDRGEPLLMEPDKCLHWRFFDFNDLPSNLNPSLGHCLEAIERGIVSQEIDC